MAEITLKGWECERCEHQWVPRDEAFPRVCPKCKSPYWDKPRQLKPNSGIKKPKIKGAKLR